MVTEAEAGRGRVYYSYIFFPEIGNQAMSRNTPPQARHASYTVLLKKIQDQLNMAIDWGFKLPFGQTMGKDLGPIRGMENCYCSIVENFVFQ